MRKYILTLLILSVNYIHAQTSTASTGEGAMKISLKQAMDYAIANNGELKKSKIDVLISKETVKQTVAIGLPQVTLSAGLQYFVTVPGQWIANVFGQPGQGPDYIFLQFQQKVASSGTVAVNQLIFDGSYIIGLKATKEFLNMSKLLEAKSNYDVQVNVSKAYLMVASTKMSLDLLRANIKVLSKSLSDITALNKEGFTEDLDVKRVKLALSNLTVQEQKLVHAISTLTNVLKVQMGMPVSTVVELTDDIETIDKNMATTGYENSKFNASLRPEYSILNQSIKLGELDKRRYKMGYVPQLFGFYQHQQSTQRPEFNFFKSNLTPNNNWVPSDLVGLQFQWKIFDGFSGASKIKEVQHKINKAKVDLETFANASELEFINAKATFELQLKQAALQKENMDLAKEIYEKSNLKFKEGVGSSLEIVQAETELKTAQNNYLNSVYDLVIAKIEYYKSIGKPLN
jgi:outer membrane protein TolC